MTPKMVTIGPANMELKFYNDEGCYFLKFGNYNKIFIHTTTSSWFNRSRYNYI